MSKTILSLLSYCIVFLLLTVGNNVYSQEEIKQKEILPDWFSITDSSFDKYKSDPTQWFASSDGKSKLYFIPYTDYSVSAAILTNREIKDSKLVSLLKSESIKFDDINAAIEIDEISSEVAMEIGVSIDYVKDFFGNPDAETNDGIRTILSWSFSMLENGTPLPVGYLRPLIVKGLEYNVTIEFINNKLVTLVYYYEVP